MVGSSTIVHDPQQRCYIRADDEHGDTLTYHYFLHTEEFTSSTHFATTLGTTGPGIASEPGL